MAETEDEGVEAAVVHLGRWAARAKTEDAADSRVRERLAQRQAEDEATLASVLLGLTERRAVVAIHTHAGSTVRGTLAAIGADFVAVVRGAQLSLLPLSALNWVRPEGAASPAAFADRASLTGRLVGLLASLAADAMSMRLVTSGETLVGDLVAVGDDVLTVRPAGAAPDQLVYVPVASLSEVSLRLSG